MLAGVNIDQSNSSYQQPGIDLKHGSYAQITVEENTSLAGSSPTNIIKGFKGEGGPVWNDQGHAAINVDYAAHLTLTVNSSDAAGNTPELACYGGQNSAGIGGSDDKSGEIEIHMNGGDLLSYGGSKGAGIGGGNDSDDHKYIRIYGHGSIDAEGATNGGVNGCGIGSGEGAKGDEITIIGDNDKSLEPQGRSLTIKAYGEGNNAAIGFGQDDGNTITIENCIVTAMNSDTSFAACIGTGRATYAKGDEGLKVSITNCDIKTKGSKYSTGIGAGYDGAVKSIEILNSTYEGLNIGSGEITGKSGNAGHVHLISICNSTVNANANLGASGGNNETARPRAGIGSGPWANVGKIEITGHSHVTATGTKNAAGIGTGGVPDDFGTALWLNGGISYQTNIVDSEVTATGGAGGAGIGGGKASRASSIYIQGSTVTATAGESKCGGAGIGGGFRDGLDNITIGSSKVTATGAGGAAGIGTGGNDGELIGNINGRIHVGYVFITNRSNVTATGGENGAGIGSGWGAYIGTGDTQGISINNSAVHAQGGMHGAGIGGGADGPDANTGDGDLNQLYIGGTCQIEAYGGKGAAGIGGGFDGFAENLVFDLATDVAGNGSGNLTHNSYVKAVGGAGAAGIGAGACDNYTGNDVDGITINGGYIEAVGGGDYKHEDVAHGTGAGIGGGEAGGSLHNLTVNGGYIKASSPDAHANGTGCGIGHGGNTNSSLPNSSDSNIRINGGTFDVQSWSDECDIVVDGGTFITPIKAGNHTVKNSNGQKLYRTAMYIEGFPAYQAAGGRVSITSDKSYGLVDAYTDNEGGLYYMLPESGDMQQTADCDGYRHYSGTTSTDNEGILKMSTSVDLVCEGEQVVGGKPFTIRLRDDSGWPGAKIEWEFANGKEMFEVENHQDTCPGAFITLKAVKAGTYTVKAHLTSSSTDGGFNKLYWGAEGSYAHSINTFDTSIHFLNDPSKVYDGEPIDDPVVECINPATPVIDYKTPNGKYTSGKPTDAGTYTVRARVPESWPYPDATDTMDITVSQRPITFTADSIQESSESKHQGKTGFVAHINNLVTKVGTVTVTAAEDGRDEQTRTYNASDLEKENGGYCLFVDVADFNLKYKTTFTVSYASGTGNYTTTDPVTVDYDLPENDEPPVITKLDRTLKMQGEGSRYGDDKYRSYVVLSTNYPVAKGGLKMEVVQDVAYGNISEVAKEAPTVTLPASENIEFTEKKSSPGTYEARINPTILNAGRSTVRFTIEEQNADAENTVISGAESQYTFDIMQAGLSTQVNVNDATQTTVTYGKTDDLTYSLDKKQLDISLKWGDTAEDILSLGNDVKGNKVDGYSASVTAEKLPEHAGAGTYTVGLLRQGADATVNGTTYQNVFYSRNYWLTTAKEATVTVEKAQITLRANDATGSIGHEPTYSYTSSGIAPWETESAVLVKDTKAALSDDKAYADLTAGTYENAITVKNAALAKNMDSNYESDIKVQDGTLTINKAAYEGTLTVRSKTYDGAPLTATYEVIDTATGKLVEDADKVQLTYAKKGTDVYGEASAIAPTDAGTYRVTLSVAGDASHDELKLQKTATIDKASAPRIVVNDAEGEFGGKEPTYTYEVEGLVGNDQADDVVTAKAVLDTKVTGGSYDKLAAGTYPAAITAERVNLNSDNYQDDVKVANGTLYIKVHEVQLEPSVTVSNKVYDGKPVEAKTSVKGYAEGDERADASTLTYYDLSGDEPRALTGAPTEAGSYRAEFTVADSTNAAGTVNYRGDTASWDFQIKRAAAPTLAAQPAHMAYHQSAPTLTYTISGLVEGDGQDKVFVSEPAPAAVIDTAKTDHKPASELDAGTYQDAVTVENVVLTEFGARNYKKPRVVTASLTVTKAQLALSLDVNNKVYDGEALKPTKYTATDPATGLPVEVKGVSLSYVEIITNEDKTTSDVTLEGAPKDAGTYRVTYTVPDTANYLGGSVSQKVRIYRAIPNPESPALEPIEFHEGLMASEEPFPEQPKDGTWSWTRRVKNQKVKEPGTVTALAMFKPYDTRNYATVYRNLTFEVYESKPSEPKRLKLSITAANKTYDGQPYSDSLVTTTAVDAVTGEPVEVKGSIKYYEVKSNDDRGDPWWGSPSSAGGYEVVWTVESTKKYLGGEVSTRFLIEQAPAPTINVDDAAGTWRGSEPEYTYTVSGLVDADKDKDALAEGTKAELDRSVTGNKGYQNLDAGVYASAITVKDPQLNKAVSNNYKNGITVKAGTLTIAPVTPTAAVTAKNKTYDGTPAEVTCSVTDPASGEKLDSSYGLSYYRNEDGELAPLDDAPVDAGSYTVVMNVPAQTNYNACEARCDFTIAKAPAPTIRVDSITGEIGAAEPAYTYKVEGLTVTDTVEGVLAPDTAVQLDTTKTGGKAYADLGLGAYEDVLTVVEPRMTTAGSNNYEPNITVVPGTLTVKSFQLGLSVEAESKIYDGKPAKVSPTITEPNTGEKFDATGTLSYVALADDTETPLAEAPTDAGTYKVILTVEDTGGYHGGTAEATFSIDKATPTLKLEATSKVYDGDPAKITAEVLGVDGKAIKGAGALTFASAGGEALAESPVNAGSYSATLSAAESTNYLAAQTSQDFTIAKAAAPTINVKDASAVFGEPEPAYSFKVSGLAGKDEAEDVIAQGTAAALDSKLNYGALDAGKYDDAITVASPQLSEKGAVNYEDNIKVVPGTLTIEPAEVKGTVAVEDKTYDGKPVEPAVGITNAAGKKVDAGYEVSYYLLDGDKRTEDLGTAAPKNAGSYEAVLRVTDTVNYRADEASCKFTIAKHAAPKISVDDAEGTWRGSEPEYTYTVSGLVDADKDKDALAKGTKAELDRSVTGNKGYQNLDAGVYASAITVKDPQLNKAVSNNYKNGITVKAGTLTIAPVTPTAAVTAKNKTYDGTPAEVTCSVTDPASGEKLDSSYGLSYYRNEDGELAPLDDAPVDAGSYTVVMNVPAQTNYNACEARCDFTIAKAPAPTINVKDASAVFGEPEPAYSFKVSGLAGKDEAEDVIAQGTAAALDSKLNYGALDAGKYDDAITVASPQLSEKGAVNYEDNIKVVPGTLTIEPAEVKGTVAVEDKTYDGKPVEPAVGITNAAGKKVDAGYEVSYYLLDGDKRTEDLGTAAPKNAGSYEAVLRVTDTVNYRADEASCKFTIAKHAAPKISVDDAEGTWRGSEPIYTYTVEGLVEGETADGVIQSTAAALDFQKLSQDTGSAVTSYDDLAVGTYAGAITVANAQLTDTGKVNYQNGITVTPGTLTVKATPLKLTLDVASKTYDGAPVTATWSVVDPATGNKLNDLGTLTYYEIVDGVPTKLKKAPINAGTYLAELSADAPANYTAEPITASFSIYRATPNPDTPQLDDLELRDGLTFADEAIPDDPKGSWSWADGTRAITKAGTESGLAIYTPADTRNYFRTARMLNFNVVDTAKPDPEPKPEKPELALTIEATSKVYDGMPASITTEVRDSATGTVLTVNGTLTYFEVEDDGFTKLDAAPVDAGNYAVLFQVAETDEYAAGSATAPYDIYRAVPAPQVTPLPDLALTDTLKLGDQQLPADDKGTWTWVAPETALTATGGYRFLARYTPNDTRNYISVVDWWTFNVVDAVKPDPDPTPDPTPDPDPAPDPDPTPEPEPNPDPTPEPDPDPTPEPNPNPDPNPDPTPDPTPNPADPGGSNSTTTTTTTTTATTSKIPDTGDHTLAIVASLGIAGGIIVAAALMLIKRRA